MTSIVQDVCQELLPDLDEDIFEYIVGALEEASYEDEDAREETATMVASFLESAGYLEEADEALAKAHELIQRVIAAKQGGGGNATTMDDDEPKVLSEEVKKMTLTAEEALVSPIDGLADDNVRVNRNTIIEETPEDEENKAAKTAKRKDEKAAKKEERNRKAGKLSAVEQAEADRLQVDAELAEARVRAIRARTELGAFKGALDAKSFTLPNPGGGQPLLEDAACRLVWGRRYGLIGRNGMGKSTLLRAFAARRVGDVPPNVTVHYVSQEVNLTEAQRNKTPVECVVDADLERALLLQELQRFEEKAARGELDPTESKQHGDVLLRLEEIEANSAERRAKALLDNLGFSEELQQRPLSQLSGGWRVRTMLAAAIFAKPDLLLLDEPTNHLSILAVMWLARELSTSDTWKQRIVVIVSHDRHFMDEVCTDCLHISGAARRLTQSRGNYSLWAKRRKDEQALFAKEQASRQAEIDSLREYAGHGFKYGGSSSQINKMGMKAKQADKLERIHADHAEELAALQEDMELPIKISAGGELDGYVVQLLNVGFGYPNATPAMLFQNCEFGITSKSRIVLLGENGNGVSLRMVCKKSWVLQASVLSKLHTNFICFLKKKTTLVKLIMGDLEPTQGEIKRNAHARFALVNQHHADQIDLTLTPLQFMQKLFPGDGSYDHMQKLRGHLSSCGVTSGSSVPSAGGSKVFDLQNTPASALSGGQRSRVALAAVSFASPHVLVLDEPTNNLDLESVAALAESVQKFEGAVICVSHDQYFVQAVANEAWVVAEGTVKQVSSFDAYRQAQFKKLSKSSY
eukprot:scaffold178_cov163-Amphora_coffeaeformis.AAC.1